MPLDKIALRVVNQLPSLVAYWDRTQRCAFANNVYLEWFGKTSDQMIGISMKDLLGPLYQRNLPYILGALRGERQQFERQIKLPSGEIRETIASYIPDIENGEVQGFSVVVTDVTLLRKREAALEKTIRERDEALERVRALEGVLPICSWCKSIRDESGTWHSIEAYVSEKTDAQLTHGMCPDCLAKFKESINDVI
jgi:PAS domain S-box-containing protein